MCACLCVSDEKVFSGGPQGEIKDYYRDFPYQNLLKSYSKKKKRIYEYRNR